MINEFINAACVPLGTAHSSGSLTQAEAMLAADPGLGQKSIYTAAILGDLASVGKFLHDDPDNATEKGGPRDWDALTHLCFSRFLRQPPKDACFVNTARALLDAGANPNTGFYESSHQPTPCFESVLYGVAGIAHHEGLTRLLLERGADPNDGETPYHVAEGYDNGAFQAVFESGKLDANGVATLLLRKIDFHDGKAINWLLEQGVGPNVIGQWGKSALQSAIVRGNGMSIIQALLDHGADPTLPGKHGSATDLAARYGRGDALASFKALGKIAELKGLDRLLAACARDDVDKIAEIIQLDPSLTSELLATEGRVLVEFAGSGNTPGVSHLLELGVDVNAIDSAGDGYFGIARNSTALHAAAWRARHQTVRLLIERGADLNLKDGQDRTALMLAVKACVNSYWIEMRAPDSVAALLSAGASVEGVQHPCGYEPVDDLLADT